MYSEILLNDISCISFFNMNNRIFTLALFAMLLWACNKPKQNVIGIWENTSLNVTMKLDNGTDSTMRVPEGSWEEVLKIKPIITTYNANGTFKSEYFSLDNKPMGTEEGTWRMRNDSLVLNSLGYDNAYKVIFDGDKAQFVSLLDWDQDGKVDDLYSGWQKRVKQ